MLEMPLEAAKDARNAIRLQRAIYTHLPALLEIENASFPDPWKPETIAESLEDERSAVLVALEGEEVCGYGVAWVLGDEADIMHIAVAPAVRGRGIGTQLLNALIDSCEQAGAQCILLEVRSSNEVARRLYERLGFTEVGIRRRYYGDAEDAVTMRWERL